MSHQINNRDLSRFFLQRKLLLFYIDDEIETLIIAEESISRLINRLDLNTAGHDSEAICDVVKKHRYRRLVEMVFCCLRNLPDMLDKIMPSACYISPQIIGL